MKPSTNPDTTTVVVTTQSANPRAERPMLLKILVWVTCASLLACGTASFILGCISFLGVSQIFVAFYLMAFGVIACLCELRIAIVDDLFAILRTDNGMGLFFCFVGTLGMSIGVGKSAAKLVPFISGIAWIGAGVVLVTGGAIFKCQTSNRPTTAVVENA